MKELCGVHYFFRGLITWISEIIINFGTHIVCRDPIWAECGREQDMMESVYRRAILTH